MRYIIPISGKDSLATALVQKELEPDLDYEYVFNPTGAELPEVFEWIDKVEVFLGKPIHRVGENLLEIIEDYNYYLPNRRARYCTRQSKIEPFEKWIGKEPSIVYYGIRDDEVRGGYDNGKHPHIVPSYPLKKIIQDGVLVRKGYGINEVYQVINEAGLKPPTFFWEQVYIEVCKIMRGEDVVKGILKEWQIDFLFCWRTRANCYFCFNQRKIEWVGLLEFHPDLFWNAEKLEHSESEYYWNGKDYPLTKIVELKDQIIKKHIKKVVQIIRKIRQSKYKQISMFDMETEQGFNDFFKTTSCGLFCGK